jgi:hypothetical protein
VRGVNKYLWGAAAMSVAVAAGTFFFVDYALRNPQAGLVRYGVAAVYAGLQVNPLRPPPAQELPQSIAQFHGPYHPPLPEPSPETVPQQEREPGLLPLPRDVQLTDAIQIETVPAITSEPPIDSGIRQAGWEPIPERAGSGFATAFEASSEQPAKMPYADETSSQTSSCCKRGMSLEDFLQILRLETIDALGSADDEDVDANMLAWILSQICPSGCKTNGTDAEECEPFALDNFLDQLGAYFGGMCWDFDLPVSDSDDDDQCCEDESEGEGEQLVDPVYHHHHECCPYSGACNSCPESTSVCPVSTDSSAHTPKPKKAAKGVYDTKPEKKVPLYKLETRPTEPAVKP